MRVPTRFNVPDDEDCHAGRPCSSLRVAVPAEEGTNHLLGHVLGGLRHYQNAGPATTDKDAKANIYTHRHPNCDHLAFVVHYTVAEGENGEKTISAVAGSGDQQVITLGAAGVSAMVVIYAPWGSGDSGDCGAALSWSNVTIRDFSVFDVPRVVLDSGDHRVEHVDSGHRRVGLTTERYIADSDEAGPPGLVQQIVNAWDDYHPQVFSWWSEQPLTVASGSWTDPFGGAVFRHRARQKKASDTTQPSRWRVYTKISSGTYQWRARSVTGAGTVTSAALSNTAADWQSVLSGLNLSCLGDDRFYLELIRASGVGTISIYGASGIEGTV